MKVEDVVTLVAMIASGLGLVWVWWRIIRDHRATQKRWTEIQRIAITDPQRATDMIVEEMRRR